MCEPMTIAAGIGAATSLAGTGLSIAGQLDGANEAKRVADFNASMAEAEADAVRRRGAREAREIERQGERVARTGIAITGGAGVRGGTIDNIFAVNRAQAAADAAIFRQGVEEDARALEFEAGETRRQGAAAHHAGVLGAVGTGISGFGGAASSIIGALPGGGPSMAAGTPLASGGTIDPTASGGFIESSAPRRGLRLGG